MSDDVFYMILGGVMFYSIIHFLIVQMQKTWKERTKYERIVTIAAIVSIAATVLDNMLIEY